ncbi:MAG: hypothetical protein EA367_14600 [Leptolyngbya sp. DLM2.Bin15]|nr:MAG: hypothetical protein EA367_14600 [Leptolyngbya sp. DLM2.Bin15]
MPFTKELHDCHAFFSAVYAVLFLVQISPTWLDLPGTKNCDRPYPLQPKNVCLVLLTDSIDPSNPLADIALVNPSQ